jgi:Protein of unknown function (DUF3237)
MMEFANIQMKPLYRMRMRYTRGWSIPLGIPETNESQNFFIAEGFCVGRITGKFTAANHPLRRVDGTYIPDLQGVIETDDGAFIYFSHRGYGRTYPEGRRQVVAEGSHVCSDERYNWLNDSLAAGVGEVRSLDAGETEIVMDWFEIIWAPIPD